MNIIQGSILDFEGDAIVNPANSFLNHGGGLARVIDQAAQTFHGEIPPSIAPNTPNPGLAAIHQYRTDTAAAPLVPTGGVAVTGAGLLPYQGIIHAVGPVWGGGKHYEAELLAQAHGEAIAAAIRRSWKRIAFPAISCGIFGYPVEHAAKIAVDCALGWEDNFAVECSFYLFEDAHYQAYYEAAGDTPGTRGGRTR